MANLKKFEEIQPGQSLDLLNELHLLTKDKQLNQDARRKLKQIYHLAQLLKPSLDKLFAEKTDVNLVDVGSGKSYLGFLLWDLDLKNRAPSKIWNVERRPELVQSSQALALRMKLNSQIKFIEADIESSSAKLPARIDMLLALHACDTATDAAISLGLKHEAQFMMLVPCCQAETAKQLGDLKKNAFAQLWAHPLHARIFGSHLVNVLRALFLESKGYKVTVTEFTSWEHTQKNELILAEKIQKTNPKAEAQLKALLELIPVCPSFFNS